MQTSYRGHFAASNEAESYDREEYSTGSYSSLLWELEKTQLGTLVQDFHRQHPRIEYLDFAAGTGRVTSFLESQVDRATAIEISEAMATRARARLRATQVLCLDITQVTAEVEGTYDLITAFRFFLNAEPMLRLAAIQALAARLRDDTSWLVFNNHGNLWSTKLLNWPYHRLARLRQGWTPYGNYLRHSEITTLLGQAGLRIVKVMGFGVLGGKVCGRLKFERALRLETGLCTIPMLAKFGQDQIYIVSREPKLR